MTKNSHLQSNWPNVGDTPPRSPFQGWPTTTESTNDNGTHEITVAVDAIRPFFVRLADMLCITLTVLVIPAAIIGAFNTPDETPMQVIAVLLLPFAVYPLAKFALYRWMRTTTRVLFTPETISSAAMFGKKRFDRNMPHKFALYPHEKGDREEEVKSFKDAQGTQNWWRRPRKRYYTKSYRLSLDYLEQRNDLMLIYGHKTAQLALARLNAADKVMDGYSGKSHGQALRPQADWQPQAGELQGEF